MLAADILPYQPKWGEIRKNEGGNRGGIPSYHSKKEKEKREGFISCALEKKKQ